MNRIVLIGNGFDLAHGLPTRYEDFINWYWEYRVRGFVGNLTNISKDVLCSFKDRTGQAWNVNAFSGLKVGQVSGANIIKYIRENEDYFETKFTPFFKNICTSIETKGWVDIENEYYSLLIRPTIIPSNSPDFKILNLQLEYLRLKLIDYLKGVDEGIVNKNDTINEKIYRPIKKNEIALANNKYSGRNPDTITPNSIMLLSFNYTKTPLLYLKNDSNAIVNYIHGSLDDPESIIFGYGDELDSSYEKLRNLNDNECLRNIKSIKYLEMNNYRRMLDFIETEPFQVCIMGHSCGNSDRTLLNTLFEHPLCVSIKPYYYKKDDGTDNYLELVQNISRNFTDMKLMRDRVVNKTYCEPLT